MAEEGLDGALFLQNADLVYLAGTTQAEAVFLPVSGDLTVAARPLVERTAQDAPWAEVGS